MDRLNRWRWRLLFGAIATAIAFIIFINFAEGYTAQRVFGIITLTLSISLGVLILIKTHSVPSRMLVAFYVLFGIGIILWFLGYIKISDEEFYRNLRWTIQEVGIVFSIGFAFLLLFRYLDKSILLIPVLLAAIIIGLVLNRLGAYSEAEYLIFLGFLFIAIVCLREAIASLNTFKKRIFRKRLFFITCLLLCICNGLFFAQFASYELRNFGIFDILQTSVFLILIVCLFIAMPFSNYLDWAKNTRKRFVRIILLPSIFLYLLLAMRFVLPTDTYRKILFKEYAGIENHFGMKDYDIKKPK